MREKEELKKASELAKELDKNLSKVHPLEELDYNPPVQNAKAIIAP